jgi:hypothetical protein
MAISTALAKMPVVATEYVYIEPGLRAKAEKWLKSNRRKIIAQQDREEMRNDFREMQSLLT